MKNETMVAALLFALALSACGSGESSPSAAAAGAAGPVASGKVVLLDSDALVGAQSTGTACSLDTIDDSYAKEASLENTKPHVFRGWMLSESRQPAGKFDLVLKGTPSYAIAASTGETRKDVGEYFKDPAMSTAGFSVSSDLSGVPAGVHDIIFVIERNGRTYYCDSGKKLSLH
jgi:hypothetical protein